MKEYPHDYEMESVILGILINGGINYIKTVDLLEPSDFWKHDHAELFKVIRDLYSRFEPVDPVIMNAETNHNYIQLIADLTAAYNSDDNILAYTARLKKVAKIRNAKLAMESGDMDRLIKILNTDYSILPEVLFTRDFITGKVVEYRKNGADPWVSSGWATLDDYYRIGLGQLTVLTGIPNSGKSNWMDALMVNIANRHKKWKIAIYSPENLPIQRHVRSFIEKISGYPFFNMEPDAIDVALEWIHEHFIFIDPDASRRSLESIISVVDDMKDINGFLIDPWNELEHSRPASMTETEYVAAALMRLKSIAVKKNIHVWIVAHPTKLIKKRNGTYPVPTPYDISGSANWRNKPDNCLSLHRDFETGQVEVHVQKVRFKDFGKIGMIRLNYDQDTGKYSTTYRDPMSVF